jgi:chemotaxis protein CheZ
VTAVVAAMAWQARWRGLLQPLAAALEAGREDQFLALLDTVTRIREQDLWRRLDHLDGQLRSALDQLKLDPRVIEMAGREMPGTRERLDYVLRLTDDAAHRTLDLVEASAPLVAGIAAQAHLIATELAAIPVAGEGLAQPTIERVKAYLAVAHADGEKVRQNLQEVLLAQGYQDLTGQIIRRVIELVAQLESELAHIVHTTDATESERDAAICEEDMVRGLGPSIPSLSRGTVCEQESVDELLQLNSRHEGVST